MSTNAKEDKFLEGCGIFIAAIGVLAVEAYILNWVINSFHPGAVTYLQSLAGLYLCGSVGKRLFR